MLLTNYPRFVSEIFAFQILSFLRLNIIVFIFDSFWTSISSSRRKKLKNIRFVNSFLTSAKEVSETKSN